MESVVNSIRDILRKEGITGMDSINHCIVFLISRMLDEQLCKKLNIDSKYIFDNITKDNNGNELGNQDFYSRIFNRTPDCLIGQIMFKLGFRNIKFKLEGTCNLKLVYDKLKNLNTEHLSAKYDLIGTIYELHLKSGTSNAMRDLGQYYTHRLVIDYMIQLCDPQMKDGVIEKIVDPTMGTGGFLTMSVKYLNNKYNNKIDWQKNKNNIIGFDIDENVKNMALLNIFLEIGELCSDTLIKQDTLHYDMKFTNDGTILEKADVILANEPMGLKNIIYNNVCDRIKNMKIKGTKAEPLFLQLFMQSLNDNGRCAVIVPDGVLFNESNFHSQTRKYLIKNFNLKKIISLNDDFFINTGVKTSILYFVKDGSKTKRVEFCEIKLKNGEIEENSIIKVKYSKIKKANYSLFVNKYNATEIEKIEGIEYKKLGEVCEFKNGKNFDKKNIVDGEYPVIGGGMKPIGFHNEYNVDENTIIISKDGANAGYVSQYDKKAFITGHGIYMLNFDKSANKQYVYHYLRLILQNKIYELQTGSAQPGVNKKDIEQLQIPVPSLAIQEAIVERLDVLNSNIENSNKMIDEYRNIIKYYVDCQTKNEKEYKFSDIISFIKPKKIFSQKDHDKDGKYNLYSSSINEIYKINEKTIDKISIIINATNGKGKCVINCDKDFSVTSDTIIFTSKKEENINTKYLHYYFVSNANILEHGFKGINHKHISKEYLTTLKLRIPSKEKQNEIVEYCDNLSEMIIKIEQQIKNNKELMKQIMDLFLKNEIE